MAILTTRGRTSLAAAIKTQPLHLALGEGDGSWTTPPTEPITQTALLHEVGRRAVDEVQFVTPDIEGAIVVSSGRFRISTDPTNNLFIRARFDFTDASTSTIREQALFVNTITSSSLPAGQRFFTLSQLTNPGILFVLQYSVPTIRQASTRESFEFVITF